MSLQKLQKDWEEWAEYDPLYAILMVEGKEGRRWNLDEFFETLKSSN